MDVLAPPIFAMLAALAVSYLITPLVRSIAHMVGFVDRPDGRRKVQRKAVALGGGIACLIAASVAVLFFFSVEPRLITFADSPMEYWGLLVAIVIVVGIGVADDSRGVPGSYKLLAQVIAASALIGSGMVAAEFFDYQVPALGVVFTLLWLIGTMNSFNLIDGVDGLAGSVGVVFSITFGSIAMLALHPSDAIIAFALAGALLGFLRYNMSKPSTIYLGDTGSMLIGLILGVLAIRCQLKRSAILASAVPLTVWAIPIFDSAAAVNASEANWEKHLRHGPWSYSSRASNTGNVDSTGSACNHCPLCRDKCSRIFRLVLQDGMGFDLGSRVGNWLFSGHKSFWARRVSVAQQKAYRRGQVLIAIYG